MLVCVVTEMSVYICQAICGKTAATARSARRDTNSMCTFFFFFYSSHIKGDVLREIECSRVSGHVVGGRMAKDVKLSLPCLE